MQVNKIFITPKPNKNRLLRLFCFPYAGGSATSYISWVSRIHPAVELIAIEPPGRASRMFETPHNSMVSYIDELMASDIDQAISEPYILMGHSLGASVAFEFALRLEQCGHPPPLHFIASGRGAPHIELNMERIHDLPDPGFINAIRKIGGTKNALADNKELMDLVLPSLRADFRISENHLADKFELDCPITAIGGDNDDLVGLGQLNAWSELTRRGTEVLSIQGDHFFVDKNKSAVIKCINEIVETTLQKR